MRKVIIDLTGQKFGMWKVVRRADNYAKNGRSDARWLCKCECGTEKVTRSCDLRNGESKGCIKCRCLELTKHGQAGKTPEYRTWTGMRHRCRSPKSQGWANYGGRGIKVCDRWDSSFLNFFNDM